MEQYDFVIYEQFFFLEKHLAEKYNKPVVRIFTAPVTNAKLMEEYITSKGPLSIFKHKWITKAFTKDIVKAITKNDMKGNPLKTDNWLDEIIYNPPELNFVYTLREYQPYEEEFPEKQYKFLGPSIYERKPVEFDFAKMDKAVVYISLGTVLKGAVSFFQTCVDAFSQEDVHVIISVGKNFDVKKLKNISSNIHIYPSVPQLQVLQMADVFVTHGGMNSVSESIVYGVPMVVIPFVSDQPVNARCIEKLGVGKKMDYAQVNSARLKEKVLSVLCDSDIKDNLKKVKSLIDNAPGNKGAAEMIIDFYKESVK